MASAIFWGAVASCVVAQLAILRAMGRNRDAGPRTPQFPEPRRLAEVVWAVLPVIALAAVLVATWRKTHPASVAPMRSRISAPHGPPG